MRPDALEGRRLFNAWVLFATAATVFAGLFALAAATIAAGTHDGLGSTIVGRLLVGHVFFSLVLACTAFVAALWIDSLLLLDGSRFPRVVAWIGFWLAVGGALLAVVGTLGTWGDPVLTEFVPVVVEPVFLTGFGLFMAGVAVTTGCYVYAVTGAEAQMPLVPYGLVCTAAMMVAAGLAGIASITRLFGDLFAFRLAWRTPYILFQAIFWGPAHLIQFAVIGAMVAAWVRLLPSPGLQGRAARSVQIAFLALVLFAAITLVILYARNPLDLPKATTLNVLVSDAQALPVALLAVVFLKNAFRTGLRALGSGLTMSILLFAWSLLIAFVGIRQTSTAWVPSHYDAMIPGAVLLAFMAVATELVQQNHRLPSPKLAALQPCLYGGGILAVSLALLWSALVGGERRGYFVTMPAAGPVALLWIGGIAAGLGVLAFATNIVGALSGLPDCGTRSCRQPARSAV